MTEAAIALGDPRHVEAGSRRDWLAFAPQSSSNPFRAKRVALVAEMAAQTTGKCRIIDLGGTPDFWTPWKDLFDWSRTEILCVNLDPAHAIDRGKVKGICADATALPHALRGFDLAFSNSLIEHIRPEWRIAFADEVRRIAKRYVVQTPDYWCPIEPHARLPVLHWLPRPAARRILMAKAWGFLPQATSESHAEETLRSMELLTGADMRKLFPDAEVRRERFVGIPKALLAVRGHHTPVSLAQSSAGLAANR